MIRIELELYKASEEIDGLSRGHMTIYGSNGLYTSKQRRPDQSMMIFLSIPLLLDGIRQFVTKKQTHSYTFVGIDCSFQFLLTKSKNNQIKMSCDQKDVGLNSRDELIQMVWNGVSSFISMYGEVLGPDDIASNDLHSSMKKFKDEFCGIL